MWLSLALSMLARAETPRLTVAGPDVLAAYEGRVLLSTDRGATWANVTGDLAGHDPWLVRGSSTTWVALADASDGGALFVSVDRGVHWEARNTPPPDCGLALAADGRMFSCNWREVGVQALQSTDGSAWADWGAPFQTMGPWMLGATPSWLALTGDAPADYPLANSLWFTIDSGATWDQDYGSAATDGTNVVRATVPNLDEGPVAVDVALSADGGRTWRVVRPGLPLWPRVAVNGDSVAILSGGRVLWSVDRGAQFVEAPAPAEAAANSFVVIGDRVLFAVDGGVTTVSLAGTAGTTNWFSPAGTRFDEIGMIFLDYALVMLPDDATYFANDETMFSFATGPDFIQLLGFADRCPSDAQRVADGFHPSAEIVPPDGYGTFWVSERGWRACADTTAGPIDLEYSGRPVPPSWLVLPLLDTALKARLAHAPPLPAPESPPARKRKR